MSSPGYAVLQDVIMDADFPELDLALRRGRHVDRDDAAFYSLLSDAQELLEGFYQRYGCELIHRTDGYYYLLPTGEKVSRRQLSVPEMVVGQALALMYLDPAMLDRGGVVTHEELVGQLSTVLGNDPLIATFNPGKRKRIDERIAQRNVRKRVAEATRKLSGLGFVELLSDGKVRLRSALMRFAEPVRGQSEPAEMLAKLVQQGEVALAPDEDDEVFDDEHDSDEHDSDEHDSDHECEATQHSAGGALDVDADTDAASASEDGGDHGHEALPFPSSTEVEPEEGAAECPRAEEPG